MSELSDYTHSVGISLAVDTDSQRRARCTVAHHSTSAEECRELLAMLGLLPAAESPDGDVAVVP